MLVAPTVYLGQPIFEHWLCQITTLNSIIDVASEVSFSGTDFYPVVTQQLFNILIALANNNWPHNIL